LDVKRILSFTAVALTAFAMVGADVVDAKRLGGGRSLGAQRQSVAPPPSPSAPAAAPSAAPAGAASNPVMPPGAATARSATAPAAAAAAGGAARTGMARWMGPLAGVAAGLGLAWLAHSLGLSEALLSALLIGLAVVAVIVVIRMLMARRAGPGPAPYARAGNVNARMSGFEPAASGNDARAEPVFGSRPAVPPAAVRYPPGFDAPGFLEQARKQFNRLQAAYDAGDRELLSDVMTPELYAEVARDLDDRRSHIPTEVIALNPEIVDVTTEGGNHWASVRFRGLLREDGSPSPKPFDEMWNLVKPADGSSGWQLAGIRQLDEAPVGHA
jgi:predicted lipid-binding transport protein (Tim44 family)